MSTFSEPQVPPPAPMPDLPERYRAGALVALLRLHWFANLRWAMLAGALAALGIERMVAPQIHRPEGLFVILFALAAINLVWTGISRSLGRRVSSSAEIEAADVRGALLYANLQVATDLLVLTLILHFTGGVENPMAIFYLFHMAIGALLLHSWQALLQGVWAVTLYAVMAIGELVWRPDVHHPFLPGLERVGLHAEPTYVAAAIVIVACGVFGTLFFMLRVATRLDAREQQLRSAHRALQQSQTAVFDLQRRKSRFLQTSAHQLKSPLAGIQTLTGLIRDGILPEQTVRETCEKIIRRCRDGIDQVTEMLTLARVEEVDPDRHRKALSDVGKTVSGLCQQYQAQAEGKGLMLEFDCQLPAESGLRARVDSRDLADCVGNLIENAIKYTDSGGRVSVIVARSSAASRPEKDGLDGVHAGERGGAGDFVAVIVKDTGMGIEADALRGREGPGGAGSIFDAFRRGNGALAARIPGTGLGLSIVREVVEKAGGRLKVHSRPGKGSTFSVMFPTGDVPDHETTVRNTRASEIVIEDESQTSVSAD